MYFGIYNKFKKNDYYDFKDFGNCYIKKITPNLILFFLEMLSIRALTFYFNIK